MIRTIRKTLNKIIELFKWPFATASLLVLVPSIYSIKQYYIHYANKNVFYYFAIGFGIYLISRLIMMGRARSRTYPEILTHEITHSLFALLTFHKVTDIESSWGGGGRMSFIGEGNWLIAISPYFFPLLCSGVIVTGELFLSNYLGLSSIALIMGIFLAYHISSIIVETHSEQTDLKKVGWGFTFAFIPGANLFMIGLCFAYADNGLKGMNMFVKMIGYVSRHIYNHGFSGL
jgi:hypothetical protein